MLDFINPSHPAEFAVLRLVAEAQEGGGDVFDIGRLCRTLEPGDTGGWERGWLDLAQKIEAKAQRELALGHKRTALQFFFHANQYYRMSDVFLPGEELERRKARFLKCQENFQAAAKLHSPKIESIRIPCGSEEYDGYLCHPANPAPGKWPVVFLIGGADAFSEELYFDGRPATQRGWALVLVDTPGRGSSIYVKGIPSRPDYEVPVKACIDYLASRPELDPHRIAIIGISMAGYYAPRAVAFEPRAKAYIGWSGCYSVLDDLYEFCPNLRPTVRRLLGGVTDAQAREQLKAFTMSGIAQNIKCPTLITHGGRDIRMSVEGAKRLFKEIGATDKALMIYDDPAEGGTIHCSHDYWAHNVPFMLDWLEERL
ncbi:MAG TPA: prolyl oligopeptidase family serine peptidase [Candidatus Binatia bacterium]|nr:prolyl oligopeptidase family serine peptidase [Candidatus Binatia bacterium]